MRLTLHTDYALRTLIYLGASPGRRASVREIARFYDISENHLVKIIHRLGRGGFLETARGRGGGLRLARPPEEIRVGDVVRYTEEHVGLTACLRAEAENGNGVEDGNATCCLMPDCQVRNFLEEALGAFFSVLDGKTIADALVVGTWGGERLHAFVAQTYLPEEQPANAVAAEAAKPA